jgi:hypothetical protein
MDVDASVNLLRNQAPLRPLGPFDGQVRDFLLHSQQRKLKKLTL